MIPLQQKNTQNKKLYGYQKIAYKKVISALIQTARALMVMATGLGKTFTSAQIVKYFLKPNDTVLFICHESGILNKAFKEYRNVFGNKFTFAKFYGGKKNWNADKHNFVFATFQSMIGHMNDDKENIFSPNHFKYIIVDESHHAQAETFSEVIKYFTPVWRLGMTATPDREDEEDIRDLFGKEVVNYRLAEGIAKGWLTPVDYRVLSDGIDEEVLEQISREVLIDGARLSEKQINQRIFIKMRTEAQCQIIDESAQSGKSIVFCENIEHLRHVSSLLPSSVSVHSQQSDNDNENSMTLFEEGKVRHILAVDKFNEGIDIPNTELLNFLRGTNSRRIWEQQLGRGLRLAPGKKKVVVNDFVANIERIRFVKELVQEIEFFTRQQGNGKKKPALDSPLHVQGKGFSFDFDNKVVDLMSVFERVNLSFYDTWQEASKAAILLEITSQNDYIIRYKEDPRLPSSPDVYYKDFPGMLEFLGRAFYSTWQEASIAAIGLGINSWGHYRVMYKKDFRLPSNPNLFYKDFPGFSIFLQRKMFYPTWQEASEAAGRLGITTGLEYKVHRIKDPKLPSSPNQVYEDFPGYLVFLKQIERDLYKTTNEASKAAVALGIKSRKEYYVRYKEDPKLPSQPHIKYPDFPGYEVFLNTSAHGYYSDWQEASKAAVTLGIKSRREYRVRYKEDSLLSSRPEHVYKNFPGFDVFLRKEYYLTWQECSQVCLKLGIKNRKEYQQQSRQHNKLPGAPDLFYKDFPGWSIFLGE